MGSGSSVPSPKQPKKRKVGKHNERSIWNPERPEKGDQDKGETWKAVGVALSMWGRYEAALGQLFTAFVVGDGFPLVAGRIFGAIRTAEGRRDMLNHAADAYFAVRCEDTKDKEMFGAITKTLEKAMPVRNSIAHGVVAAYIPEGLHEPDGLCLQPQDYDSSKRDVWGAPKFAYTAVALTRFALEFGELTQPPQQLAAIIRMRARASRNKRHSPRT
jgi:hypothetical protein